MHVLVPVDGSDPSDVALEYALEQFGDEDVLALTVIDPVDGATTWGPGSADDWLDSAKSRADAVLADAAERAGRPTVRSVSTSTPASAARSAASARTASARVFAESSQSSALPGPHVVAPSTGSMTVNARTSSSPNCARAYSRATSEGSEPSTGTSTCMREGSASSTHKPGRPFVGRPLSAACGCRGYPTGASTGTGTSTPPSPVSGPRPWSRAAGNWH
jgi:hypothetical protein